MKPDISTLHKPDILTLQRHLQPIPLTGTKQNETFSGGFAVWALYPVISFGGMQHERQEPVGHVFAVLDG
ncbi:MAG TPA: hypothetical protein VI699_10060, partial [Candidatus Acidoferrales bacterium]|nr:hypothetical protein [Candidatus Acidoferrales bacterium]